MKKYPLLLIAALISFSPPAWSLDYENIVQGLENLGEYEAAYPFAYKLAEQQKTYSAWRKVAANYAKSDTDGKAFMQAWRHAYALNQESTYKDFLKIRPNSLLNLLVIHAIFELTKASDTIADYWQFMKDYPEYIESVEAFLKIQELAFERAKTAKKPLVYDAFVNLFTGAKQNPEAVQKAFEAEKLAIDEAFKVGKENFKNHYKGTKPVENFINCMLEQDARDLLKEARMAKENHVYYVAARKYCCLLEIDRFKNTDTVKKLMSDSEERRDYFQLWESAETESTKDMKSTLVEDIQRQLSYLGSNFESFEQAAQESESELEKVIDTYNRFMARQLKKSHDANFDRSFGLPYLRVPLSTMYQQKLKNAFENANPQQAYLLALE